MLRVKGVRMNLVALSFQTLHTLHQGVYDELQIIEQCTLLVISKVKRNNEQIFIEKVEDLKEKEELEARSQSLEVTIT